VASAAALEPHHQNPGLVAEPPRPSRVRNPVARAWLELEAAAQERAAAAGMALTILRPAAVATRGGGDYLSRVLGARLAVPLAGHDPSVQLLAPRDLAEAVGLAVSTGAGGGVARADAGVAVRIYHVAPAGVVPLRAALRLAGTPRLPVGRTLQRLARALPGRLGWTEPIEQVDYLRYSVTVGNLRTRQELGFVPRQGSVAALREMLGPLPGPSPLPAAGTPPAGQATAAEPDGYDDYGMDRGYIAAFGRTLFHFLHRWYWRIEVCGLEQVPRSGRAMLVGVHRGFMPWDGVMALHTVVRGLGRYPRFLIHPGLVKFPFLANYMTKLGGVIACQENADYVLGGDELLGMFPEGIQGAFTSYRDAYRLGRFGRDEYVKIALRNRAPIVPFVTVGSAEIFPILGKIEWRWFQRLTEWPCLPLTPTFPLLPVPLPSKWHTRFLEPLALDRRYGPEAAQDAAAVRAIGEEVRGRMQEALDEMRRRRRSIFFGSIFHEEETAPAGGR
jgi:1-acyl-sn-glycerol-3-phosphate acyltransferase